jgi:DNA-binding helix-hairpin-helix protein with protein kinase domain
LDREIQALDGSKKRVLHRVASQKENIERRRRELHAKGEADLARALEVIQKEHIEQQLRLAALASGQISGIGPQRTADLNAHGITSAADVELARLYGIPGISYGLRSRLLEWKNVLSRQALSTMPRAVPPATRHQILSQNRADLDRLDSEMAALRLKEESDLGNIDAARARSETQIADLRRQRDIILERERTTSQVSVFQFLRHGLMLPPEKVTKRGSEHSS